MSFMINCNNKGCGKYQTPVLDLKDQEVYCVECQRIISGVSIFMKNQMKALGQTKKPQKSPYAIRCVKCKVETLPKLGDGEKFLCGSCGVELNNISAPFKVLVRKAIKEGPKDI